MTRKIFRSMIVVALVAIFTGLLVATTYIYDYFNNSQINQLKEELELVKATVNRVGLEYFDDFNSTIFRFTVVDTDGTVLYDTVADAAQMENHSEREEIKEAYETGYGSSRRDSSTLTKRTFYEAVRLSSGMVLRISVSQMTVGALLIRMLPIVGIIFLAVGIVTFILAAKMTEKIIEPISQLDLEHTIEECSYEELSPILAKLNKQKKEIEQHIEELHRKADEFNQITLAMNEGLILIDDKENILSINDACRRIYSLKSAPIDNNILSVDRTPQMSRAVKAALEGERSEFEISKNGCEYQFNVNPIQTDGRTLGAVILAFDITDKVHAQRNRQEFTANVTHELKTPLQSIMGSAELMVNGLVKSEDIEHFAGNIHAHASRLLTLINDIISLSQLDENAESAQEAIDICEVAREVTDVLTEFAARKGVTLAVTGESCIIYGVRKYIYEIIYNLCDNAIRYNIENGRVDIDIYRENNRSVIAVADTGIGIDEMNHTRIFERFYRVDKSHSKETGGTGLGLSIVKHAVMYHKGKIELDSEIGKGTTIKVTL